jgi:hypothetical protein
VGILVHDCIILIVFVNNPIVKLKVMLPLAIIVGWHCGFGCLHWLDHEAWMSVAAEVFPALCTND